MKRITKKDLQRQIATLEDIIDGMNQDVKADGAHKSNVGNLRIVVRWNRALEMWNACVQICETDYSYKSWSGERGEKWTPLGDYLRFSDESYLFNSLNREEVALKAKKAAEKYQKRCDKNREMNDFISHLSDMGESVINL